MSDKELLEWIEKRLKNLKSELDMDAEKYREKMQSKHMIAFDTADTYAYRVGIARGEISYLLNEIKRRTQDE